jgi:hypothetical protein
VGRNRKVQNIRSISPLEKDFFAKEIDFEGIPIKSGAVVADRALYQAWDRLHTLLEHIPDVISNLISEGVELHIIGKNQVTSDLPEHQHLKGLPFDGDMDVDDRTRGLGGRYPSCGEENLLRLRKDRYYGRDICVHEFAHTIQEYGLNARMRKKILAQYQRSISNGLWNGCYSATNDREFFAELSMWYFGTHGDPGLIVPPAENGADWFRRYDLESFDLLDRIYTGRAKIGVTAWSELECLSPKRNANSGPRMRRFAQEFALKIGLQNLSPSIG